MLFREARRRPWSSERISAIAGVTAALSIAIAVVAINATIGTQPLQLPRGHHTLCDGAPALDYPTVPAAAPMTNCRLVRAL